MLYNVSEAVEERSFWDAYLCSLPAAISEVPI